jgi:hypothetical protein
VKFGNENYGDETARLGIKINRDNMNINAADEALCGKRLAGSIVVGAADTQQARLLDDAQYKVNGVFDVKGYSVKVKHISTGLTFSLESIDREELSHFARQEGHLIVETVDELVMDEGGGEEDAEEEGEAEE